MHDVKKPVEMERGEVEELLGEMGKWRRCMSTLEDLLRRWSIGEQSQEERE